MPSQAQESYISASDFLTLLVSEFCERYQEGWEMYEIISFSRINL